MSARNQANPLSSPPFIRMAGFTACILAVLSASSGCQRGETFVQSGTSETFVQDYNPQYLDVLWVVDDRSPMRSAATLVTSEATTLFGRLDAELGQYGQYRMGIISTDATLHEAELKPEGAGQILTRGDGTLSQRTAYFQDVFAKLLNLNTGAESKGLQASLAALDPAQKGTFLSDPRIPLVLVYFSYSDETSVLPTPADPIEYYAQKFLALKNGNADLIRVYAADYLPLPAGTPPTPQTRCAELDNNEIDIDPAAYQNRYFKFATRMNGNTADLCQPGFAQTFDLTGLRLKQLPNTFLLQGTPQANTLSVAITQNGQAVNGFTWHYDTKANQIVFDTTPPEGTTIVVTYLPG